MMINTYKNKRVQHTPKKKNYKESREPNACNPLYHKAIIFGCHFCMNKSGRKKRYKNLYQLYHHFCYHHPHEQTYKEHTLKLADLLLNGVLL